MDRKTIAYWATTGLFCAVLGFSGFAHFTHLDAMVEAMTRLGYPTYFMTIIGLAKLCGVVALLAPGRPVSYLLRPAERRLPSAAIFSEAKAPGPAGVATRG